MTFALTAAHRSHRSAREEGDGADERQSAHKSVMVAEVLAALAPKAGEMVLDATAGQGGHSEALLHAAPGIHLIALDADPSAVAATQARLASFSGSVRVVESNFADSAKVLKHLGVEKIHKALFDLGWRSEQLASGRGFSFLHDEPLDMSYGSSPRSGFTAVQILNGWGEQALADVFFGYGEERYARRIAAAVVERRKLAPIHTTVEFAELVKDAVPALYRRGRIHPATKSFQALRIAVNDELGAAQKGIETAWEHLSVGGRIAVISFHSIEDRLVKVLFAAKIKEGTGRLLYKKPLTASQEEISHNPRARSAKLRVIEKI
jgi:16S rRNA (cytosine1402-N4)-methyltransferase